LIALAGPVRADGAVVVVVNRDSGIGAISRDQAADIFLGRKTVVSNNITLSPVDSSDHRLRERFYQSVAGMTTLRVKAYWSRLVFSGQGRPPPELSPQDAGQRIAGEASAVTYLLADQVTPAMKVLLELP
jgi:hypothetical protein